MYDWLQKRYYAPRSFQSPKSTHLLSSRSFHAVLTTDYSPQQIIPRTVDNGDDNQIPEKFTLPIWHLSYSFI